MTPGVLHIYYNKLLHFHQELLTGLLNQNQLFPLFILLLFPLYLWPPSKGEDRKKIALQSYTYMA